MTGLSRTLGLAVFVLGSAFTVLEASPRQDLKASFDEGVELLKRGREDEALSVFREILASEPSDEEALALWMGTDQEVWIDLLVKGGEFELIQKAMFERVNRGRAQREADVDVIRPLVDTVVNAEDALDRRMAISQITRDHGEYAAPLLVNFLRGSSDNERRINALHAIQTIGPDMVLPLIESLRSDDPVLRRSVAAALGNIGDARAGAALAAVAAADDDDTVREIASEARDAVGGGLDPVADYLQQGVDYRNRDESVLRSYQYSDVVWDWANDGLESRPVENELYHDELAERSFRRALEINPSSLDARSGLVSALVSQHMKLEDLEALGVDVAEVRESLSSDQVTIHLAGTDALDAALQTALAEEDASAAVGLCRMIGMTGAETTGGLTAALDSPSAPVRSEAAIAMGHIAMANGGTVDEGAIGVLAEAAGREVVQLVAIIDGDQARSGALITAFEAEGISVSAWGTGAEGLSMINRMPGLDLILVSDQLADVTSLQVIDQLQSRRRTAETPIVVLSSAEDAEDLFGDKATAIAQGPEDMEAIQAALEGEMNRDRAEADRLAAAAAEALAFFARSGVDISSSNEALASTLAHRDDAVAIPAMQALGNSGGQDALSALAGVAADDSRSDEARETAARACAGIFRRGVSPSAEEIGALTALIGSDASLGVQNAAALALGSSEMSDEVRVQILENISGSPSN